MHARHPSPSNSVRYSDNGRSCMSHLPLHAFKRSGPGPTATWGPTPGAQAGAKSEGDPRLLRGCPVPVPAGGAAGRCACVRYAHSGHRSRITPQCSECLTKTVGRMKMFMKNCQIIQAGTPEKQAGNGFRRSPLKRLSVEC